MTQPVSLAACAEMRWLDKPLEWRVSRLTELGFGVGLWNWPSYDLDALERTGADFTIVNGYVRDRLADDAGADELLATARETAEVGKRLGIARLNLHGTGLDGDGTPLTPIETVTGTMWLKARDTLDRIADLGAEMAVTFTLENLNLDRHPGCPFNTTAAVLALVSAVDRKELPDQSRPPSHPGGRGRSHRMVPPVPSVDRRNPGRRRPGSPRTGDRRDQLPRHCSCA